MWEALYSPNTGLAAFRCKLPNEAKDGECGRVVRTLRGIKSHALKVHGARQQEALFDYAKEKPSSEREFIRASGEPARSDEPASFPGGV